MTSQKCNKRTYEDFFCMDINHLKDYLTVRGISTSNYTKIELVARAFSAAEMDIPIIQMTEEQARKLEYRKKLKDCNLPDPCKISNSEKIDDVKLWPPVNLGNIFEYILGMREFNNDYIGKYKDQKPYSYFDGNFVGEVLIDKGNDYLILFCNVRASVSIHDDKELWIVVKPTGKIVTAWCLCMAGVSRCCNYIIATLYKVEYVNSNCFCAPSCTSMPCGWNQSTKKSLILKGFLKLLYGKT